MSKFNDSVPISVSPKSSRRKIPLGIKKPKKTTKKTYYESPLKHISLSHKRSELIQQHRKSTRSAQKRSKNRINPFRPQNVSGQNSIIVLSDTENETDGQNMKANSKRDKKNRQNECASDPNNSSIIIVEPLCPLSNTDQQASRRLRSTNKRPPVQEDKVETCTSNKRMRYFIESQNNNDSSCLILSPREDSEIPILTSNSIEKNIASALESTNEGTDDIVVVWSSKKDTMSSSSKSPVKDTTTLSNNTSNVQEVRIEEGDDRLFMIDYALDKSNLSCIEHTEESEIERNKPNSEVVIGKDNSLPFSKAGLEFPQPVETSTPILVDKLRSFPNKCVKPLFQPGVSSAMAFTMFKNTMANMINNASQLQNTTGQNNRLRQIIIDGNNIAMAHTNGKTFSEMGLKLVIDYFKQRGHIVKAFVPQYRRATCHQLLEKLYSEGTVVFTPSRNIAGRRITPYDDRYILEYATMCNGIVVSLDQYRDLYVEKPEWRDTIANRLLAPTFVDDYVMFPIDPLGRNGPRLDEFLKN